MSGVHVSVVYMVMVVCHVTRSSTWGSGGWGLGSGGWGWRWWWDHVRAAHGRSGGVVNVVMAT